MDFGFYALVFLTDSKPAHGLSDIGAYRSTKDLNLLPKNGWGNHLFPRFNLYVVSH